MNKLIGFVVFYLILTAFFKITLIQAQSPTPISINSDRSIPNIFIGTSVPIQSNPYISASGVELVESLKFGGYTPDNLSQNWAFAMKSRLFNPNNTNVHRNDTSCNVSRPLNTCNFTYDLTQANAKDANGEYLYSHVESWATASTSMPGYVVWCMPGSSSSIYSANSYWQVAIKDPNNPTTAARVLTSPQIQNADGTIVTCTNISKLNAALCNLRPEGCNSAPPPTPTPTPTPLATPTPTPTSLSRFDVNGNGTVQLDDLELFISQFADFNNTQITPSTNRDVKRLDINQDQVIDIFDYNILSMEIIFG